MTQTLSSGAESLQDNIDKEWIRIENGDYQLDDSSEKRDFLRGLWGQHRRRLMLTYVLFNLENLFRLFQPFACGIAINGLLLFSYRGLLIFLFLQFFGTLVSTLRQMYDTRVFTSIYASLATQLVLTQHGRAVEPACIAARSALSREFVEFFEREVPVTLTVIYSVVGTLVMLCLYDMTLAFFCLLLLIPVYFLSSSCGSKILLYNKRLNDQFEREVEIIKRCLPQDIRNHYDLMAEWKIKISDSQAINFGLSEFFALGLIVITLVYACRSPQAAVGDIFALFRYVSVFTLSLSNIPLLVAEFSRLRDIFERIR